MKVLSTVIIGYIVWHILQAVADWKICALISSLFLEVHNTIRFAHMHKFALAKSKIWTRT